MIRLARDPDGTPPAALIDVMGGRITFDGIEFQVEGAEAAIRADDVELNIRRCTFRRTDSALSRSRPAAVVVKATARPISGPSNNRRGSLWIEASEFEGGQVAISASGPVEVGVRDCTFGPAPADQATIWAENAEPGAIPAEFLLRHTSVLAGSGPVFQFSGIAPRVRVSESAFAPPTLDSPSPTLVAIDSPDRLDWRGVDNVYGRFGTYLQVSRGASPRGSIRTYEAWAETDDTAPFRETGSIPLIGQAWEEADPLEASKPGSLRPSRAFQLKLTRNAPARPGSRLGPAGPLPPPVIQVPPLKTDPVPDERATRPVIEPVPIREFAANPTPRTKPSAGELDDSMKAMPLNLPVDKSARETETEAPPVTSDLVPMPMPIDPERPAPSPPPVNSPMVGPPRLSPTDQGGPVAEGGVIRSAEEFRDALGRSGPGTRTLVISADADWTLPACRVRGMSSWVIQAERGGRRPVLRFRPEATAPPNESWSAWMTVFASGLRLEGIDLVLPAPELEFSVSPAINRKRALFALAPGTIDLTVVNCSLTIEGDLGASAGVVLLAGEIGGEGKIRFMDSLIRVGGDVVDVAGGRRLDLEMTNAVVASGGSMIHAQGLPEGRSVEELKVVLRQVTARMAGGLAHLQSAPGEPGLPVASINARDVVLATGDSDAPLLRVDGQNDLESLQNLIRWEGRQVAYDQITTYRRDQSSQPGAVPILYNRDSWKLRIGEREESPIHDDLKFPVEWPPEKRPWSLRRDDLRLPARGPAVGADLRSIPNPPAGRS